MIKSNFRAVNHYTLLFLSCFVLSLQSINAQYFGRNKVQYEHFEFEILESDNFAIYHYLNNEENVKKVADLCELWYQRHLKVFRDTFPGKNPYIVYNNHADFQQNTIIQSLISTGTHGVTEALRTRVVIPYLASNKETSHVIGHELVHVFQYNMLKSEDSLVLGSVRNLPLWMVEGMAEYMSIGRTDMLTSMWMRDAVEEDDIPTLKDMSRNPYKYFPYRYGHSFWAFVTSHWGDAIIRPLFKNTAKYGYQRGVKLTLGLKPEALSKAWERSLKEQYSPYLAKKNTKVAGEKIFSTNNAGRLNISPSLSPDGQHLVFMSNRDVISIVDIFLADPDKKKIIKKLTSAVQRPYIDEYMYLGSTGTWSPDNEKFALTTFAKGDNQLLIVDVEKQSITRRIKLKEVESFSNPSWSPDGNKIMMTGLVSGQSDLYLYNLDTKETKKITNDKYSDLHPEWSPDGKAIVFISDRGEETDFKKHHYSSYRLCFLNMETDSIVVKDIFPGANNINPFYSADGNSVYFLSNADGFRNLYEYDLISDKTFKLTDFYTGITGMTEMSPAFTLATESGDIVYSVYRHGNYELYKADPLDFLRTPVDPSKTDFTASVLPPGTVPPTNYVDEGISYYTQKDTLTYDTLPYSPKFRLEYIGNTGVGIGISQFGAGAAGGVNLLFSDMLKRNQIYSALQVNGELQDIGGAAIYVNQARRFNWGAGFMHVPYRRDYIQYVSRDTTLIKTYRTFIDEASLFSYYPLSKKQRIEGGVGYTHYGFDLEVDSIYYTPYGRVVNQEKNPSEEEQFRSFGIINSYIAFVGDNSHSGLTSPLHGYRYRFQIKEYFQLKDLFEFGDVNFLSATADYRKYHFVRPFAVAFRLFHYGRYQVQAPDQRFIYPIFIGYDYFVRGYNASSFQNCYKMDDCFNINRLAGNKMTLTSAELRLPFTGPERLTVIGSQFLYTDLVLFFDGGMAWNSGDKLRMNWRIEDEWKEEEQTFEDNKMYRIPVYSTGISLRVNLFGMLVLEPYYAWPFQRASRNKGVWGMAITSQGW